MRKEYPRPELVRENWIDLNGEWDFAFDFADTLVQQHPLTSDKHDVIYAIEKDFPLRIRVPFCPESELSGIGHKNFIVACWYRKTVRLQKHAGKRWLLHFEAAYYRTHVFVNGKPVCVHRGGYTPFGADITVNDRIAVVNGVRELYGANVYSTDLRGGAALVLAALAANGTSTVGNIYHIDRGYECIEKNLSKIGALIERKDYEG